MPATQTITLSMPEPDIALLTLDLPGKGANLLSTGVLEELSAHLDDLEGRTELAGLIIRSGKPGMFIAGASLDEFAASLDVPKEQIVALCRRGQTLFGRLSQGPFVTVAAIDGICLGGGAELAAWCDRRLMTPSAKTQFGFPEVKVGLYPGWGGTVRMPRIVGLGNAVEMITSGEPIDAEAAVAMGLAADAVAADRLLPAAIELIRNEQATGEYLRDRRRWSEPISISETELGFLGVTASAVIRQQTKGHYPAPEAALETMLEGALVDAQEAAQQEAQGMAQLFGSPINAALLNVFFLTDRVKKDKGVDQPDLQPGQIGTVGVVGAGIMGAGIAAANMKNHLPVMITDAMPAALAKGVQAVFEEVAYNKKIKGPDPQRMVQLAPLLNISTADAELAACDLLIEAVVENAEAKKEVYARLEPQLRPDAILASNTSTLPITGLAENLQHPERFCGLHFFNPVRRMKLVEVIRGQRTSDQTVATVVAHAKRIGKFPIVVQDGPGFLVNRLLFPYMNEALELLSEGAEIRALERAAESFGMPMGPIALYDMVGLDTALYAGQTLAEAFPERLAASPILPALVQAGRLGQKSGQGFYSYQNPKRRAQPDPQLPDLLGPYLGERKQFSREELTNRLFLPMLLEATRVLESRLVRDVRDVDLGLIFGIGFPPFRGGLLFWADTLGAARILEMLEPLAPRGERFRPTKLLLEMGEQNRKFYPRGPGR